MKNQKKKLKIYMHVAENSGVGYFRQYLPAMVLRDLGLAEVRINDFRWGKGDHVQPTDEVFFETCNWADIIIAGRLDRPEYYSRWGAFKEFFNMPIVLETDDNIHHVPTTNPGYQGYGPNSESQQWNIKAMTDIFDAMTVTTNELKDFYGKYHPRIYVLPNSLDVKEWEKHEYRKKKHKDIRMGFVCSGAHMDGFGIIQKPVYDILKKHKNVTFYYPDMYWRLFENAPKEIKGQLKNIMWINLKSWPAKLQSYGIDIGLAPLRDNMFNRSKSNLRYLEYSLAGMASVVSPVKPYLCVNDGVDGIIAKEQDDWFEAMDKLITDEKYRKELAKNSYDRVHKDFNMYENAKIWVEAYQEIVDKFHSFYGPKKEFVSLGKGKYSQVTESKDK
ncbi:MAG: glycosyltransferase [Nanoarchaeota archaeon]|nr:glycosyltransferase [Nanoarchaeota archaeon]